MSPEPQPKTTQETAAMTTMMNNAALNDYRLACLSYRPAAQVATDGVIARMDEIEASGQHDKDADGLLVDGRNRTWLDTKRGVACRTATKYDAVIGKIMAARGN